jgi:hypothetical protein
MRFRAVIILSCVVLALSGCGYFRWQKAGASSADFKADRDACAQPGTSGVAFTTCMQQHGWSYTD